MTSPRTRYGILLSVLGTFCLASAWVFIKLQGERIPLFEIVFFRALAGFIFLYPIARMRSRSLRGRNHKLLFIRSILGFVAMCLCFYAVTRLPLGDASMLFNTSPLFVALFAPFLLKEKSDPVTLVFALVAFAGIGMILKPTMHVFEGATFAALISSVMTAMVVVSIRRLHMTDNTWVITTWFTGFVLIASAIPAFQNFVVPTKLDILLILGVGIAVTGSQILMTKSYRYGRASTIAPFAYLTVVYSYVFDIVFWHHIPDLWSIIGTITTIGAGIGIMLTHKKEVALAETG